jgi:hypothetical protein
VLRNARILIDSAALLSVPVVVTEQYTKGLGPTVAALAAPGSVRFEKTCFSSAAAPLHPERPQVALAGMEAHVCVLQSALELRAAGRDVFVVEDACCSRAAANHANAMRRLAAAGVIVANTESLLFEWMRDARHEHFKAISAMLR